MKKIAFILVILLLSSFSVYPQIKYVQKLGQLATISFPDTPQIKIVKTDTVYLANYKQSIYLAQSSSLSMGLKDMFKENSIDGIYEGFAAGVLNSTKGKLLFKNKIFIDGLNGIEFGFKATTNGKDYYDYQRAVYLNNTLISYSYLSFDTFKKDDKNITDFFNTFKLILKKDDVRQSGGSEFGYLLGAIMGYLVIIGIIVGIGFAIAFIIRKIKNKKL